MAKISLIITADDFGISHEVNQAVIKGWQEGILTSASLMVTGVAFDEAIELARNNPGLQLGLHLILIQGRSALRQQGFPALTDPEGNFPDDPLFAGMRMFFLRSLHKQLESEIEAQIVRFIETGLPLSHIDGHLNIHMHPTVFDILCRLMPRYGINTFRLSRERLGTELRISPRRKFGKGVDAFIFSRLTARSEPELRMRRIGFTTEVKGLLNSGGMTEDYLLLALAELKEGLTEIYLHPATMDNPQMPGYRHKDELASLLSPRVKEKIRAAGIELCNYRGETKDV